MKQLFNEFGYCVIPKGTPLFRTNKEPFIDRGIFFALEARSVPTYKVQSLLIQKWITKQDIKVLFATNDIEGIGTKTLANIYNQYVADLEKVEGDLCIKNGKDLKQVNFVSFLKQNNISGWFASIEGSWDFEVCLFPNQVELKGWLELEDLYRKETLAGIHSLEHLKIFPSENFWKENKHKLNNKVLTSYKNNISHYVNEDKLSPQIAKARSYNLKVKLAEEMLSKG